MPRVASAAGRAAHATRARRTSGQRQGHAGRAARRSGSGSTYIGTGDILREAIRDGTADGQAGRAADEAGAARPGRRRQRRGRRAVPRRGPARAVRDRRLPADATRRRIAFDALLAPAVPRPRRGHQPDDRPTTRWSSGSAVGGAARTRRAASATTVRQRPPKVAGKCDECGWPTAAATTTRKRRSAAGSREFHENTVTLAGPLRKRNAEFGSTDIRHGSLAWRADRRCVTWVTEDRGRGAMPDGMRRAMLLREPHPQRRCLTQAVGMAPE